MANAWSAARARISSLVMKAALAAAFADSVAVATAAIELAAIGLIGASGITCTTWITYGYRLAAYGYRLYWIGSRASQALGCKHWVARIRNHARHLLHLVCVTERGLARDLYGQRRRDRGFGWAPERRRRHPRGIASTRRGLSP